MQLTGYIDTAEDIIIGIENELNQKPANTHNINLKLSLLSHLILALARNHKNYFMARIFMEAILREYPQFIEERTRERVQKVLLKLPQLPNVYVERNVTEMGEKLKVAYAH